MEQIEVNCNNLVQFCLTMVFALFLVSSDSIAANREIGFRGIVHSANLGFNNREIHREVLVFANEAAVRMRVENTKRGSQPYRFQIRNEKTGGVLITNAFSVKRGQRLMKVVTFAVPQSIDGTFVLCGQRKDRRGRWRRDNCQRLKVRRINLD